MQPVYVQSGSHGGTSVPEATACGPIIAFTHKKQTERNERAYFPTFLAAGKFYSRWGIGTVINYPNYQMALSGAQPVFFTRPCHAQPKIAALPSSQVTGCERRMARLAGVAGCTGHIGKHSNPRPDNSNFTRALLGRVEPGNNLLGALAIDDVLAGRALL